MTVAYQMSVRLLGMILCQSMRNIMKILIFKFVLPKNKLVPKKYIWSGVDLSNE